MKNNLAAKPMKQLYVCEYCKKAYHKEQTLQTHMCVRKQRLNDINTTSSRIGFAAFLKFYEYNYRGGKPRTRDDFIDSQYYIDFVRFGNYLAVLNPVHMDRFIETVIKNGLSLKDWTNEKVYDAYIEDLVKREPADAAVSRSITEMMEWSEENGIAFTDYFTGVNPNDAARSIKVGKLSPWILYLAVSGDNLTSRFNEDHSKMIGKIIDPGFWMQKFKKNPDDVSYIGDILKQAGL